MNQVEVSSTYKTIEFDPIREQAELMLAINEGKIRGETKREWHKNAVRDLKALNEDFARHPEWDKKSEEIKHSESGIVILGSSNTSSSAEYQFTPATSTKPTKSANKKVSEGNQRWDEFEAKVAKAKKITSYRSVVNSLSFDHTASLDPREVQSRRNLRELMERIIANDGRIPDGYDAFPWLNGWSEDENGDRLNHNNVINIAPFIEAGSRKSWWRAKSAGHMIIPGWLTVGRARIGLVLVGLAGIVGGLSIWGPGLINRGGGEQGPIPGAIPAPAADNNRFIKIKFSEADPDYKDYHNGNIAALRGQMAQGYFEHASMGKSTAYELLDEADKKSIEQGMNVFRGDNNPTYLSVGGAINDEMLVTRDGQGQVIEFKWRNNLVEYYGQVEPKPVSTPTPEPAQAEPETKSTPTPEPKPGAPGRVSSTFRAGPETYMCKDGLKNVADALAKAKENQCINQSLLDHGIDLRSLRGLGDGKLSEMLIQHPELKNMFPINQDLEMYVKDGNVAKRMGFQFSDSRATNLLIDNKVVNINDEVVVLTDGNNFALFLKRCGNIVFGIPQPKPVPTEAPTPAPTTTSTATVIEVRPTGTPTPTRTPVPPPAQYVQPAPPPVEIMPTVQPLPPGEGFLGKWCDNIQTGLLRQLDRTDYPCDANFRVEFLDPTGNIVLHVLDNVRTTNGFARITSPQPGMLFRAMERLDLLPGGLDLVKDDIYGRTVPAGANINLRDMDIAWALNGPEPHLIPPPPPPVEGRFPVCLDIFGRTENLTEREIRNLAASLGINPNLNIPDLQREIVRVRCTVISVTSTSTSIPTSTGTPVVFFNPTPTPEQSTSTPTTQPTPDMTPTPTPRGTIPPQTSLPTSTVGVGPTESPVPTALRTPPPTNRPTIAPQPQLPTSTAGLAPIETRQTVSTRIPTSTPGQNFSGNTGGNPTPRPTIGPGGR